MKKGFIVSIMFLIFAANLYAQDVRELRWGMDKNTVKRIESSKGVKFQSTGLDATLMGTGTVDGKYCSLYYNFDYYKNTLIDVSMAFDKPLFGSLKERANELLEIMVNKYGSYRKGTTDYKNQPAYIWETSRTKITFVPKTTGGNIAIIYESLGTNDKSNEF